MPRGEEKGAGAKGVGLEDDGLYTEEGVYTVAKRKNDSETFGQVSMTPDGQLLACVIIPTDSGPYNRDDDDTKYTLLCVIIPTKSGPSRDEIIITVVV
jgi:hypothetical protein